MKRHATNTLDTYIYKLQTSRGQSAKSAPLLTSAQSGCRIFETACSSASGARASKCCFSLRSHRHTSKIGPQHLEVVHRAGQPLPELQSGGNQLILSMLIKC